jgi:uncharacterized protein YbbC (DUF1343 family)
VKPQFMSGAERIARLEVNLSEYGRIGLVANQASVISGFVPTWKVLHDAIGDRLTALFGPQHGFESTVQDNMIESAHGRHKPTGLPVFSLYSETREPTEQMLQNVDTIVVDLQIVGCRVYTYKYTLAACLRAAKKFNKRVLVLDRPNPLGGVEVEGGRLNLAVKSFVGEFSIPMRHGLTAAECAKLFNQSIGAHLDIVELSGWNPQHYWHQLGQPWILTSPNLPTPECTYAYPGTVIFEATNFSEGRGTTLPFLFLGAPYITDSAELVKRVKSIAGAYTSGCFMRPTVFQPTFNKWAGIECQGFQIHVTEPHRLASYYLSLAILRAAFELSDSKFAWKQPPYEYEKVRLPIDLLIGFPNASEALVAPRFDLHDDIWRSGIKSYIAETESFLLYPRRMREAGTES